jgi:hypothetical protein
MKIAVHFRSLLRTDDPTMTESWAIRAGFGLALTPRAEPQMAGLAHPGPAIDPVFEAGALELQPAPAAAGIVRPNAARTFFEGPEGPNP